MVLQKKVDYGLRLSQNMQDYQQMLLVGLDNVGSRQLANLRHALRGSAVIMVGKNTTLRKALTTNMSVHPHAKIILPHIKGNCGIVFCKDGLEQIKDVIDVHKIPAPARQGVLAPVDVFVDAGPTGMDPSQTSFFQALGISTKIVKGQIEIQSRVKMITLGERVTPSASTLLQKLNIKPFHYGIKINKVYEDKTIYDASALDINEEYVLDRINAGITNLAGLSLATGLPNQASMRHIISKGFRNIAALSLAIDYKLPMLETLASAPSVSTTVDKTPAKVEAKAPPPVESESDEDMGIGLFG